MRGALYTTAVILALVAGTGLAIAAALAIMDSTAGATPISWGLPGTAGIQVTHIYTSGIGATETIPNGASQVVIEDCGAGGGGGTNNGAGGAGGGSGGYVLKTLSLTSANWGQTFTYTIAPGAAGGSSPGNNPGSSAGTTAVANVTFPTTVGLLAGGGAAGLAAGGSPGSGGTASGGDTNTPGNTGIAFAGGFAAGIVGVNCTTGVGGSGAANPTSGASGGGGTVAFAYT